MLNLIPFAIKLPNRPTNIIIGPATAAIAILSLVNPLIGSGNAWKKDCSPPMTLPIVSNTGIKVSVRASPSGIIAFLRFSTVLWNFTAVDSVRVLISWFATAASSAELFVASSITDCVCDPTLPILSNNAVILANWYLPKICSMILDLAKLSKPDNASCTA